MYLEQKPMEALRPRLAQRPVCSGRVSLSLRVPDNIPCEMDTVYVFGVSYREGWECVGTPPCEIHMLCTWGALEGGLSVLTGCT